MRFRSNSEDDEKDDFFLDTPEPKPKAPKPPVIPPTDPRYWLKDEGKWDHLRVLGTRRNKIIGFSIAAIVLTVIVWAMGVWMFGTTTTESVVYGYVDNIEKRGKVMKTCEGTLIPYKEIHDTTRAYTKDFDFSVSDKLGAVLMSYRDSGKPVKITYKTYNSAMPWRGESKRVVVRVDTVDPATILPVEYDANPHRNLPEVEAGSL